MTDMQSKIANADELAQWARDARRNTVGLLDDLNDAQLIGTRKATVNPMIWHLGHICWFQEKWVLRHLNGLPPLDPAVDALYDSFEVAHEIRWTLDMPNRAGTLAYSEAVLERVLERLTAPEDREAATYFHRLATFHEDMHDEAIAFDRQTLRYPVPRPLREPPPAAPAGSGGNARPLPEDVEVAPAAPYLLGGTPDMPFVFDNEKWAKPVEVPPFRIARAPVTNGEFATFVEAGGYDDTRHWSLGGRLFLSRAKARHPIYWRRARGGGWQHRWFNRWLPLAEHQPVMHVCWWEAEAYCAWAGRRLPREAEWELAASGAPGAADEKRRHPWGDAPPNANRANLGFAHGGPVDVAALQEGDSAFGCRQMTGNVWEWTADAFYPFPGFVVDPYREYSAPWFGYQKVLRGGSWATPARLIRNTWRNFFMPDRRDIFAGFRTCAP